MNADSSPGRILAKGADQFCWNKQNEFGTTRSALPDFARPDACGGARNLPSAPCACDRIFWCMAKLKPSLHSFSRVHWLLCPRTRPQTTSQRRATANGRFFHGTVFAAVIGLRLLSLASGHSDKTQRMNTLGPFHALLWSSRMSVFEKRTTWSLNIEIGAHSRFRIRASWQYPRFSPAPPHHTLPKPMSLSLGYPCPRGAALPGHSSRLSRAVGNS